MYEIEVKAKVRDESQVLASLANLGCSLSSPVRQDDTIFIRQDLAVETLPPDRIILRLRVQGDAAIFTLKKHGRNELDSYEKAVVVSDASNMRTMIELLGYKEVSLLHVVKTRQQCHYKDMEICLDTVDELGTFIEVEKLTDEGATAVIQEELWQFLETLGILSEDRVTQGYDTLLRLKRQAPIDNAAL